ncbi:hypothetical protein ACHAXH_001140 [Discostella pseudostelligera]
MAMLLKYRESTSKSSPVTMMKPPPEPSIGNPSTSAGKLNILRRATSNLHLIVPEPLPPPSANKKNVIGQQKHTVEIRSGGVIAFRVPLYQKMMVGGLSGVIGLTTVFPVDLIKTRLQILSSGSSSTIGISSVCRDVLTKHGLSGFYRGLGPTAVMVAPEKAIKLGVNDYLRDVFCNFDRTKETIPQQVAAGALTGVVQVAVTNPMEIVKIRLQSADSALTPLMAVRELGLRGLYTGSAVTMMRDVPYNIIFFLTYIQLKRALTSPEGEVSRQRILGSGVAAGMVAAFVGTPMDVVKSRIQMRNSPYTNGALDCARRLYGEGGSSIFFRGAVPRMAVQGPLYGIALLLFELQSQYLSSSTSR